MRGQTLARIAVAAATAGSATASAQQNGPVLLPPTPAPPTLPSDPDPDPQATDAVAPFPILLPEAAPRPSRGGLILPSPPTPSVIAEPKRFEESSAGDSEDVLDLPLLEGPRTAQTAPSSPPRTPPDASASDEPRSISQSPAPTSRPSSASSTARRPYAVDPSRTARPPNSRSNANATASPPPSPQPRPQPRYQIQPQPRSEAGRSRFNPLGFFAPNRNPPAARPSGERRPQAAPAPVAGRGANPPKSPTAVSGRAPRPGAANGEPTSRDTQIKRETERRIDALIGPRLSRLAVNVRSGVIEIRAKPYFFWQKRGVRRDLEALPAAPGYRMLLDVE